ncbi:hypothetical protein GCM10017687_06670 [Streptomyces echinatus]
MGLVRFGQVVAAQDRPGQLSDPHPRAAGGRLGVQWVPGGRVAAGVRAGVVPVDVREGAEGVLPGPAGQCLGGPVGQLLQGEQRDPRLQVLRVPQVRVQARDLDVEAPGQRGGGDLVEADLVGQLRTGPDQAFGGQPRTRHRYVSPLP